MLTYNINIIMNKTVVRFLDRCCISLW